MYVGSSLNILSPTVFCYPTIFVLYIFIYFWRNWVPKSLLVNNFGYPINILGFLAEFSNTSLSDFGAFQQNKNYHTNHREKVLDLIGLLTESGGQSFYFGLKTGVKHLQHPTPGGAG